MDRGAWQATVNGIQRVGQDEVTNTFVVQGPIVQHRELSTQYYVITKKENNPKKSIHTHTYTHIYYVSFKCILETYMIL